MSLKEIMKKCSHLNLFQERTLEDHFVDVAFNNNDLEAWMEILTQIFGEPVKPKGVAPTDEHQKMTKDFCGIMTGQTLFAKEFEGKTMIAMLWPWQEQEYTTLKIGIIKPD